MPLSQRLSRLPKTKRRLYQRQVARTQREGGSTASFTYHRHRRLRRVDKPKHTRLATSSNRRPQGERPSVRAPKSRGGEDIVKTVMNSIDKDNKQAVTLLFGGRTIIEHKLLSKDPYPITYIKLARGSCVRQDIIVHGTKDEFVEMFNLREKLCKRAFQFIVKCCAAFGRLLSMTPDFFVGIVKMILRFVSGLFWGTLKGVVTGVTAMGKYVNNARKDIAKGATLKRNIHKENTTQQEFESGIPLIIPDVRYEKNKFNIMNLKSGSAYKSSPYILKFVNGGSEQTEDTLKKNANTHIIEYTFGKSSYNKTFNFEWVYNSKQGKCSVQSIKNKRQPFIGFSKNDKIEDGKLEIQYAVAYNNVFKMLSQIFRNVNDGDNSYVPSQFTLGGQRLSSSHNLRRTRRSHSQRPRRSHSQRPRHTHSERPRRTHSQRPRRTRKRARFGGTVKNIIKNTLVGVDTVARFTNFATFGLFLGMTRTIRDMFSSLSTDERKQLLVGLSLLQSGVEEGDSHLPKPKLVLKRKKTSSTIMDAENVTGLAKNITGLANYFGKYTASAVNSRVFQNYSFYQMQIDTHNQQEVLFSKLGSADSNSQTWTNIRSELYTNSKPSLYVEWDDEHYTISGEYVLNRGLFEPSPFTSTKNETIWKQAVADRMTGRRFELQHISEGDREWKNVFIEMDQNGMKTDRRIELVLSDIHGDISYFTPTIPSRSYNPNKGLSHKLINIQTRHTNTQQIKEDERRYILYYEVKPFQDPVSYQHAFHRYDSTYYQDIIQTSFEPNRRLQNKHADYEKGLEVEESGFTSHQLTLYYHSTDTSRSNTGMCGFYSMGTGKTKCGQLFLKHYQSQGKSSVLIAPEQVVTEFTTYAKGFLNWHADINNYITEDDDSLQIDTTNGIQPVTFEDLMHKRETLTQLINTLQKPDPNEYVLVIDEAHRLYSLFYESSHPHDLLEVLFHTIRLTHKRLLLTGTPLYFGVPTLSILVNICQAPTDTDPLIPFNEREFRRRYYKTVLWKKFLYGWLVPVLNTPLVKNGFILYHVSMVANHMYNYLGYIQNNAKQVAEEGHPGMVGFRLAQMDNTVNSQSPGVYLDTLGSPLAATGLVSGAMVTVAAIMWPLIAALLFNMAVEYLARTPLDTIEVLREELLADAIQQYVMFYSVINLEQEIAVDPYAVNNDRCPLPVYPLPTEYRIQLTYNTEQNLYFLDMTRMGNSVGELDVLFDKDKSLSDNEQKLLGEMTNSKFSLFRTIEKEEMYIQHGVGIGNLHLDKIRDCNPASISALEKMVTISANYEKYHEDLQKTRFLFQEGKQYSPKIFDVLMRVAMYEMVLKEKNTVSSSVPHSDSSDEEEEHTRGTYVTSKSVIYSSFVKAGVDQIREFILVLRKLRAQQEQSDDTSLADFLDPFHDDDKNSECPKAKNIKSTRLRINREIPRFSGVSKEDQYKILHTDYCQYANTAPKKKMEFKCTKVELKKVELKKVELKKPGTHYTKMKLYTEDVYGRIRTGDKLTLTPVHLYSSSMISTRRVPTGANSMPIQGTVEEVGKDNGDEFCVLDFEIENMARSTTNQAAIKSWRGFMSNFVNVDETGNDTITMSKQWAKNPAHKYIQFEVHQNTNYFVFPISTEQISTKLGIGSHTIFDSRYCRCPHCVTLTDVGSFLDGSKHKLEDLIDTICRFEFGVLNEDYTYNKGVLNEDYTYNKGELKDKEYTSPTAGISSSSPNLINMGRITTVYELGNDSTNVNCTVKYQSDATSQSEPIFVTYTVDQNTPCNARNYFSLKFGFYVPHNAKCTSKDRLSLQRTDSYSTFFESTTFQRSIEPEGFPYDLYQRHFDQPFLLSFYSKTKVFFVVPGVSVIAFVIEDGVLKYREQALNFGKAKVVLTTGAAIFTGVAFVSTAGLSYVVPAALLATLRIGLSGFQIWSDAEKIAGQPVNITLTKPDSFGNLITYNVTISMSQEGCKLKATVEEDVTNPYGPSPLVEKQPGNFDTHDGRSLLSSSEEGAAPAASSTTYTGPAKQYHCTKTKVIEAADSQHTIIRWDKYIPEGKDASIYGPWFTTNGTSIRLANTQNALPSIRVPIINQNHTEGLNLKSFKQLFLLEPVPNPAMEDQLKARVIRFNAKGYEEGANRVSVYHYEMVSNNSLFTRLAHWRNQGVRNKDVHSTDRIFWKRFQQFSQSQTPDNLCLEKNVKMRKELSKFEKKLPECLQDSHIESIGGNISVLEEERKCCRICCSE